MISGDRHEFGNLIKNSLWKTAILVFDNGHFGNHSKIVINDPVKIIWIYIYENETSMMKRNYDVVISTIPYLTFMIFMKFNNTMQINIDGIYD